MVWTRSKQATLGLPVDALALLILEDYASAGWNWSSWMGEAKHLGSAVDQETQDALAEGLRS